MANEDNGYYELHLSPVDYDYAAYRLSGAYIDWSVDRTLHVIQINEYVSLDELEGILEETPCDIFITDPNDPDMSEKV